MCEGTLFCMFLYVFVCFCVFLCVSVCFCVLLCAFVCFVRFVRFVCFVCARIHTHTHTYILPVSIQEEADVVATLHVRTFMH